MLLVVLGTPSPLMYATTNMLRSLAEASFGDYAFMRANNLDELRRAWTGFEPAQRQTVVLFSDFPYSDLLQTLMHSRAPILLCVESFVHIVDFTMISREWDALPAARLATAAIASLESLMSAPRTKILVTQDKERLLEDVLTEVAEFYAIKFNPEILSAAKTRLGFAGETSVRLGDLISDDSFSHLNQRLAKTGEDSEMIEAFARDYNVILRKSKMREATWPQQLFSRVEPFGASVDGPISLVGEARFLTYGPFFHLPAGQWSVTVEIETANCFSDNRLGIDVCVGVVIAAATTTLPAFGVFACDMEFQTNDPMAPIQIRLQLLTGAIEGELLLRRVSFARIDLDIDEQGGLFLILPEQTKNGNIQVEN